MSYNRVGSTADQSDYNNEEVEFIDLETAAQTDHGPISKPNFNTRSRCSLGLISCVIQKSICYPPPDPSKLKPTSWLDGVRGIAALEVFIFHTIGCWASIVPAWQWDEKNNLRVNILQFPFIRTFFVSGGAAVCVFFVLSGYVLTHKSLRWIREGSSHQVYPAVGSSMFRRGFRLYIPPICLTFVEMLATRFGFAPPLSFGFVGEASLLGQVGDWIKEVNHWVNPFFNFLTSIRGSINHMRYDAVVWTIPLEFYGSFMCYILLLVLVRIPGNRMRMSLVAATSVCFMLLGSWNMFCFSAGMLLADFNLGQDEKDTVTSPRASIIWSIIFAASFYVAGFPTLMMGEMPMPGFEFLLHLTPTSLHLEDRARFLWSISGVLLLLSISQLPRLKAIFETNFSQYLGKIAFSLYLVHEFCIQLFGLGIQGILFKLTGLEPRANTLMYWLVCVVWYLLFTLPVFAVAAQVERWVDAPSVRFARWLEGKCLKVYRSWK
ncbi:hypothetical protein LSUE1_G003562 [Lachnellula suecica]|uniref:Acyltransferase 3 domain-containing protein n=1 Tax=Lachnellula suecica TaxID=602035 RepID=A0A8T9C7F6_9HELO|nr:hypothetical protein LSUE1_G003562 [Lachnellula suecica]